MGLSSVPATNAGKAAAVTARANSPWNFFATTSLHRKLSPKRRLRTPSPEFAATAARTTLCCIFWHRQRSENSLSIDDFDRITRVCRSLPISNRRDRFVATDLYAARRTALVAKRLLEAGLLRGDAITVTGSTLAEEAAKAKETPSQEVVRKLNEPLKPTGGLVILKGTIAPEGCVIRWQVTTFRISGALREYSTRRSGLRRRRARRHQSWRRKSSFAMRDERRPGNA